MAIFHEAYLFKPKEFVTAVMPYMDRLYTNQEGYGFLRANAIRVYDSNPWVRKLAGEYGGWDRNAIVTEMSANQPESREDITFWVVLFLYNHLLETETPLGLGSNWRLMEEIVKKLGWSPGEQSLVIKGHNFKDLAQSWLNEQGKSFSCSREHLNYWSYFHPFSTGGQAGWIDLNDVQILIDKLSEDQPRLPGLQMHQNDREDRESIKEVFQSAMDMLAAAQKENSGLGIIISG